MFKLFNGSMSPGSGYIPEKEQIISQLERGTLIIKFSWRKRPDLKALSIKLAIKRETKQLIWTRLTPAAKLGNEGEVDLCKVKEIRQGPWSKDFEKWPDESKQVEDKCFAVFYGDEFNLRVLSVAASSKEECERLLRGLRYLVEESIKAPYPLQIQVYLRREFYVMASGKET